MGEWFKKAIDQIKNLWAKWSLTQKIILGVICLAAIIGIIALFSISSAPTLVPVIDAPIKNEEFRNRIVTRINEENVKVTVSPTGVVMVNDEETARRMRAVLVREDLVPAGISPWELFDRESWTIDAQTKNVQLQRALTQMVSDHIKSIADIDSTHVVITFPKDTLFAADRDPVTASVIITPKIGSDITANRKKVEGIQKLLKFAVAGLQDENITIADNDGNVLNDFSGLAEFDRLENIKKGTALIRSLETQYRAGILRALQQTYTIDRVRDLNVKIDMDLSKKAVDLEEYYPVTIKPRTPGGTYDDSEIVPSITLSENTSSTTYKGTNVTPEGPSGAEGQTSPQFRDMTSGYGEVTQETKTTNQVVNKKTSQEERIPSPDRVTVSVNIDGVWKIKYDEKGKPVITNGAMEREYAPLTPAQISSVQGLIQGAIGYSPARGDSVVVTNIQFDRDKEFAQADAEYFKAQNIRLAIIIGLALLALTIIAIIVVRAISKEIDRRRRLQEEERARREQAERDRILMAAEGEAEVPLSAEEQARMSLYENIANMAKDHPDGVAQLIRTWLLEE
ncbi:MAG: flagellar M-ring protein FliF [Spirochaetaceae bacterium]|jgi:flagellar M-ring protein FliF|nr:flagellar M-ring protein FliF [Spirochaetaceae bacterium]